MRPKLRKVLTVKKIFLFVVVVMAALFIWRLYLLIFKKSDDFRQRQAAVAVEIRPVEIGTIRDVGQFSGSLIPKSQFNIAPKVSGKLKKLFVDIGDTIYNGQVIAQLDDEEYQQQVVQAEADLKMARANLEDVQNSLELARKELERAETLYKKGILSDAQFDATRAQFNAQQSRYKVASAQVANREAALETAKVRLSYTKIVASWEKGSKIRYVGERFVDEGALLSVNTPIISVIEIQPIIAIIYVTDKEYFRIKPGQPVKVNSSAFPGQTFTGQVARVAPLLRETSRQARVEIEIDNEEGLLKPGMFVNAEIEFARHEQARIVPFSSLVSRGGSQGIFLADLKEKKAYFHPVKAGIIEGDRAEIVEPDGLSGYVVTLGQHLLQDGMSILLPEDRPQVGDQPRKPGGKPGVKPGFKPGTKPGTTESERKKGE
ncbi:MAG: efflux RND transporter periplasmic adaptor subunit [Candidatus Aminicenantes bacterium]|nr:efflux RND transporter periplasmic adaptor subunit [Candidatus Aminicenantes bacterium]